jgi:hypothetical protein
MIPVLINPIASRSKQTPPEIIAGRSHDYTRDKAISWIGTGFSPLDDNRPITTAKVTKALKSVYTAELTSSDFRPEPINQWNVYLECSATWEHLAFLCANEKFICPLQAA